MGNGSGQHSLINLGNVSLTSSGRNIDINGSSAGTGDVYFTNVELNATAGNVSIYAETKTALSTSLNAVLSLGVITVSKLKMDGLLVKHLIRHKGRYWF